MLVFKVVLGTRPASQVLKPDPAGAKRRQTRYSKKMFHDFFNYTTLVIHNFPVEIFATIYFGYLRLRREKFSFVFVDPLRAFAHRIYEHKKLVPMVIPC